MTGMAEGKRNAEFSFVVDYAKSDKAKCRRCVRTIDFNHLRLGRLVQSPYFDGKQANWYHFRCFWMTPENRVTSIYEIAGINALRWDDQEKIREYVRDLKTDPWIGDRLCVDPGDEYKYTYSSSHWTSKTCAVCNELCYFSRHSMVYKKQVPDDDEQGQKSLEIWYHASCFSKPETLASVNWKDTYRFDLIKGLKSFDLTRLQDIFQFDDGQREEVSEALEDEPDSKTATLAKQYREKLKAQSDFFWKVKDSLQKKVLREESLHEILRANNQVVPVAKSALVNRITECLVFGPLEPCTECDEGQLVLSTGGYRCLGNVSAWTKCTVFLQDVKRRKLFIPDCLLYHWPEFEFKPYNGGKRLFRKEKVTEEDLNSPSTSSSPEASEFTIRPREDQSHPLEGLEIASAGKLSMPVSKVKEIVSKLGGEYSTKVKPYTVCVISTKTVVGWQTPKIMKASGLQVHVVSEGFLTDLEEGGDLRELVEKHSIAPWGDDVLRRTSNIGLYEDPNKKRRHWSSNKTSGKYWKGSYKKIKYGQTTNTGVSTGVTTVQLKRGAAVDPQTGLVDETHILDEDDQLFTATLGVADATTGCNTYYKIQLLESDGEPKEYWLFRAWGRVGTESGGNRLEKLPKLPAQQKFTDTYFKKTGNQFGCQTFEKVAGKFYPIDIDYKEAHLDREEETVVYWKSELHPQIQSLVELICDINLFKIAMIEFQIDLDKMPLGKLSQTQIQNAYLVLTELQTLIETGDASRNTILDATNRFYTLIPHSIGFKSIPLLDTLEAIQEKTKMLDSLLEIEAAYNLLMGSSCNYTLETNPADLHYAKLRCPMEVVPNDSDEFKMIETYTKNTHGATHSSYHLEVKEVFRLDREGESSRYESFKTMHNRMLLWHGSRLSNFCGILSQGLRIAPPEAPKTGYMFGKGVYFADMVSKSANYCNTAFNSTGLMLLCEVAVGNMHELTESSFITELPPGKHSTKGLGKTCPDPSGQLVIEDGVIVPTGQATTSDVSDTSLQYNEYIVYDVAQICMKYLIKMQFSAKP